MNPSQIRSIADQVEIKVIDRTQLILDIFSQRAKSREGKLQVETGPVEVHSSPTGHQRHGHVPIDRWYRRPAVLARLAWKSIAGVPGNGFGVWNRPLPRCKKIVLNNADNAAKKAFILSIIGYTNAGKSTLLNQLTQSKVLAEDKLFATLDPSSRRMRFPQDVEVIITDTVGFIRDLPKELMAAFKATLEELENADLLLHVIDISNPRHRAQIRSVEAILAELHLNTIPTIRVLNKIDKLAPECRGPSGPTPGWNPGKRPGSVDIQTAG